MNDWRKWPLLLSVLLGGCAGMAAEQQKPMPGSDRDSHGCIGSAGYAWCARTDRCERPWELARKQGLGADAAAFDRFCEAPLE
ncbi:hypothetical protein [Microvirgula aerodenitrificans]|uniref:hypothetical protein n=1 Tax=Microvirgula aerodenitrificans TaxID=57480 RepID=UPI0004900B1D|nr:hypothetical protein [Microvirgula aerodenitrificans]